ncbi:glycosyltransferase family 4 protein [Nocardia bovistercoris]|uniref:Glycosyltransferase family 4 protein n=1 Tax=Nocardia bovistercoris TaxID=2785916 RepID=A0A931I553_9NOCA|nr:glycosyltransferase family 4 protein [Nocardia bovistercoris]MBH0774744.1 glycosyltransferase family 4 protein [Nocardia bovistercoris]
MISAVFLTHTAAPSGAELATLRLLTALARDGRVRASVLLTADGPLVALLEARDIPVTVWRNDFDSRSLTIAGSGPLRLLGGARDLMRLGRGLGAEVSAAGADVVVAQSTKALLMGAIAARRAGVPLVWQVHDRIAADYFGGPLAFGLRVLGWLAVRGVVANSRSTLRTLFTPGRRAVVAYPGLEPGRAVEREAQRAPDAVRIVMVGRLTPWKGQDVLLRALPLLRHRPAAVTLVGGAFFDEEEFGDRLRALAAELDVPVEFAGHVDDPTDHFAAADIAVHASVTPEPFGQVVVEAMRAGCAVIAADAGGPTEIVRDGRDGVLVTPGAPAALAAALDRLIADPALRARLAESGRARAADFGIEETARVVTGLLATVLRRDADSTAVPR